MNARIKRYLGYPIEPGAVWQGGVFDFSDLTGEAGGNTPMAVARMALWVAVEAGCVHGMPSVEETPFDLLISTLLEFIESYDLGYRPERIVLTDPDLASQLKAELAGSGTLVSHEPAPEFWLKIKGDMANHIRDFSATPSLAESGCSVAQLQEFAEAAAAFYDAQVWQYLGDADLLKIQTPKPPKFLKYAIVLGAGRREFGLGFYDSADRLWRMHAGESPGDAIELFSLTFNPISEAFEADVALWQQHDFPLATGEAFPQFMFYSRESSRSPTPKEVEYLTIVLSALAKVTEADLDSGEWSKQVTLQGKRKRCKISIPDVLDPPDRSEWIARGKIPDSRGSERHLSLIQSVVAQNQGMGREQLNDLLNSRFTGSLDDLEYPSETPFDRAENLVYAAYEVYGRRRIQLVRQALQEDPTHIEANVLLAESVFDTTRKIELFSLAVELAAIHCGDLLKTQVGHFWGIPETRPMMRAKCGLAMALSADGQANEAIAEMLDILRLNTNDNMGIRYEVMPLLLSQNRLNEAVKVLDRYPDDTATGLYLRAQVEFLQEGPRSRSAQGAMAAAFKSNRHVIELMVQDDVPVPPGRFVLGSPEEAASVIHEQLASWMESDGFVEWMLARYTAWGREEFKRERERERKRRGKARKPKKPRK